MTFVGDFFGVWKVWGITKPRSLPAQGVVSVYVYVYVLFTNSQYLLPISVATTHEASLFSSPFLNAERVGSTSKTILTSPLLVYRL